MLEKHSKLNPYFAAMWQYFLISCNYQDSDYWLSSFQISNNKSVSKSNYKQNSSNMSSASNSLNHQQVNKKQALRTPSSRSTRLKLKLKKLDSSISDFLLRNASDYHHHRSPTLNETLFKYLSLTIYCDYLTSGNQLVDKTTGLTMLIINNLVELFELLTSEASVLDLFGIIHRNASASSLFIHSINSNWSAIAAKKKLHLLHACLKSLEGVHLSTSGQLLNLLIDKYFHLPYLSLVRYADHIACQRVEMLQSLSTDELLGQQLTEHNIQLLNNFFTEQFNFSYRHKRLISLLDQLRRRTINNESVNTKSNSDLTNNESSPPRSSCMPSLSSQMKTSPSIDFFMLYTTPSFSTANLDKEWFYNMVRSACTYSNNNNKNSSLLQIASHFSFLKSKQCALMLSNLDLSNTFSILSDQHFRVGILKDCLLLGAHNTQLVWERLPSVFRHQSLNHVQNDFIHSLWLAGTRFLFELLADLCANRLPNALPISLDSLITDTTTENLYETRLGKLLDHELDFYELIAPLTESVNAYLKSINQYPCLRATTTNANNLIKFVLFQLESVCFLTIKRSHLLTLHSLNQSLLSLLNLLSDPDLLLVLCERPDYSTLVTRLIANVYQIVGSYFLDKHDESLITVPAIHINYANHATSDMLFSLSTLNIMLKLRFILTSHRSSTSSSASLAASGGTGQAASYANSSSNHESLGSNSNNSNVHLFLQPHYFRDKIPFNLRDLYDKIYLNLCRLPILDRFMRIPDALWRMAGRHFQLDYSQLHRRDSATLPPLEYLRDPLILREHLRHILSVGWTSRAQFEYEYVNLLTLLHNLSDDYYLPMSSSTAGKAASTADFMTSNSLSSLENNLSSLSLLADTNSLITNLPAEEIKERNKVICLVIKGLSSWLLKSSLAPSSGNSLSSLYEQVGRNKTPAFLNTQLGKQYCQVKTALESFNRANLFVRLNSISIINNTNLLYMLDPVLISEFDCQYKQQQQQYAVTTAASRPTSTNLVTQQDALNSLFQISTSLSQRDQFNLLFSANIERSMIVNLPTSTDSYFYFTQVSLEGMLKFSGQWNRETMSFPMAGRVQEKTSNLAESILTNLVSSGNLAVDEVSAKTANALNSIKRLAENLTDDGGKQQQSIQNATTRKVGVPTPTAVQSQTQPAQQQPPPQLLLPPASIQRSFNRNNLDIGR